MATNDAFMSFASKKVIGTAVILAPFLLALTISGLAANIAISGFHIKSKGIELNFNIINPANGFKQLFSSSALVKLLLSVVKIILIGSIVYLYMRNKIEYLATFQYIWTAEFLRVISKLILGVVFRLCIGMVIIGIIDLIYQKWKYIKDLKMTKQQVKEEAKDAESPKEVQKKIRQRQFEIAMRIITNVRSKFIIFRLKFLAAYYSKP